jgi:GT2 family glycosyltransferase/glycosyltransferase involved in cell wall biosynthesis
MSRSLAQSPSEFHRHPSDRTAITDSAEQSWEGSAPFGEGRLSFLPFAVSERDAFELQAILRGLDESGAASAQAGAGSTRDAAPSSLVSDLRLAARFAERQGILVVVFPQTPRVRDTFEQLGLGGCLFIDVDELGRRIEQVPALQHPIKAAGEETWRLDVGSNTVIRPSGGMRPSAPPGFVALAWQPRDDEHDRLELRQRLVALEKRLGSQALLLENTQHELEKVRGSLGWFVLDRAAQARDWLMPRGSRRHSVWRLATKFVKAWIEQGGRAAFLKAVVKVRRKLAVARARKQLARFRLLTQFAGELPVRREIAAHTATVDVVICIHNALEDVRLCLDSVKRWSNDPVSMIFVDDGSGPETAEFVRGFAQEQGAHLIRNDAARGYTFAANQGLRHSTADFVVLLNSDTIVTPGWLDRLVACAQSDPRIGLVGPLSNTASWQSIPELTGPDGDWAENALPANLPPHEMGRLVGVFSGRIYPRLPFLNGFCLMVRRQVLDQVGLFDEATYGQGYGEENDFCLRAGNAGWALAVADDTYIYHRQSRSYSSERRKRLCDRAGSALAMKHGTSVVDAAVAVCRDNRVLEGIRSRARLLAERAELTRAARARWEGKRILFLLPTMGPGGGANVVFQEAEAMRRMGVDAQVLNLIEYRADFEQSYPDLTVPVIYRERSHDIVGLANDFDAFIATIYHTVRWLLPLEHLHPRPVLGYYVQDFEPYFLQPKSKPYQEAWKSYTLVPGIVRVTKTDWTRDEVHKHTGASCHVVGPSVNIDLFRPRPRTLPQCEGLVRVAAMIRPASAYREPRLTMEVLERAYRKHRGTVEFLLFGCDSLDPDFLSFPRKFAWDNAGVTNPVQLSHLLNETDVFVDFSSHQAMGLTAMEAMASGATVIVPEHGGASSFVRHEQNGLFVDTRSAAACDEALSRLITDRLLREEMQRRAWAEICQFNPERAAYKILSALFLAS